LDPLGECGHWRLQEHDGQQKSNHAAPIRLVPHTLNKKAASRRLLN
jgi:hypothetical protein